MMRNDKNYKNAQGVGVKGRRAIAYTVLVFVSILCLFWFYVLFINATRSHSELTKGFTPIPSTHILENWKSLVTGTLPIWSGMLNSFIPLIVPAVAAPAVFFYMKQYMESALPLSLVEAARIDGSGEFRTFNTIVFPLMKPAIAVQLIFTFVSSWNNYFTPALILHDDKKKTLPILIAQLRSADWLKFDMGQVYMMIAFSIFPVIIVYLFLSKFIVQGVALGSVKG